MIIIAGTGHRPNKLGGYSKHISDGLHKLAISELQQGERPDIVISGMALGWDQALAFATVCLNIPFHAYIPFKGQERMWPAESQATYHTLLKHAAKIHVACDGEYAAWKMQTRNEHMVRDCTHLLALWDGSSGGTANCVKYARSVNRPVINCWERFK